jgi:hypothetical protein
MSDTSCSHRVVYLWENLGLENLIQEALVIDLSGSIVLEHIFRSPSTLMHGT